MSVKLTALILAALIPLTAGVHRAEYAEGNPYEWIGIEQRLEDDEAETLRQLTILRQVVFAEAGNQGIEGQAAVCQVIFNRIMDGRWGNTIESVVSATGQFSVYPQCLSWGWTDETEQAIDKVLAGEDLPISTDVIYFSRQQVAGTEYVCKILDHVFSKEANR